MRTDRRQVLALLAGMAACFGALAAPAPGSLRFEQVFATKGEPATLHYSATYTVRGTLHQLEVWRDGDSRLVRRTDDAIETHIARAGISASYQMVVLDLKRKIETRVTRDDLYRIGNFTDWFDLAHGLRYPHGEYRLTALPLDSGEETTDLPHLHLVPARARDHIDPHLLELPRASAGRHP